MENTVIELFAGIGGFRVGFNHVSSIGLIGEAIENDNWKFVWANQWEPSRKKQNAYECYINRFGKDSCTNEDIRKVDITFIPDHSVLTAGLPFTETTQDDDLSSSLWVEIERVIKAKNTPFVLLENVDRLLISPSTKRGRDFGFILRRLTQMGYGIQWRTINGADYGHPQKRKRVYIFAFKNNTKYYDSFYKATRKSTERSISKELIFSKSFPCSKRGEIINTCLFGPNLETDKDFLTNFAFEFGSTGFSIDGCISTVSVASSYHKKKMSLGDCLSNVNEVPESCYQVDVEKMKLLKGAKKIDRITKTGHKYTYSEGAIPFPDSLDKPSRTILPSEGTVSRTSHIILDDRNGKFRILSPNECEMLNEFPPYWTEVGLSDSQRYSIIGDSMICGIAETLGDALKDIINNE